MANIPAPAPSRSPSPWTYLKAASQGLEFALKATPVFLLSAGMMIWTYLRDIGWLQLLQPSVVSSSGLALLATGALIWTGIFLLVLVMPSWFAWFGDIVYIPEKPVPRRVQHLLLGLSLYWLAAFCVIVMSETRSIHIWMAALVGGILGLLGYALPGLRDAFALARGDFPAMRQRFYDRWVQSLNINTHRNDAPLDYGNPNDQGAASRSPVGEPRVGEKDKTRHYLEMLTPVFVVAMIGLTVMMLTMPIWVLLVTAGGSWEADIGTWGALGLILLCSLGGMFPAYVYWDARSRGRVFSSAARIAAVGAGMVMAVGVLCLLPQIPLRDNIFKRLHIKGEKEETFLLSSDQAVAGLKQLKFHTGKLEGATTVRAWVRYEFGEILLLCKHNWKSAAPLPPSNHDAAANEEEDNACLPLQRSELRPWRGPLSAP